MSTAFIALGSNLGDRLSNLRQAVQRLLGMSSMLLDGGGAVASIYETIPVGMGVPCPPFLNSALRLRGDVAPSDLLSQLLAVEASMGRRRTRPAEPRIIDLDLLLYDELVKTDADLVLPHPRLHERRFVLEPLAEIAGDAIHPVLGASISLLRVTASQQRPEQALTRLLGPTWCLSHDSCLMAASAEACAGASGTSRRPSAGCEPGK